MQTNKLVDDLLDFLTRSPTPYQAVFNMQTALDSAGFTALSGRDVWALTPGEGYYWICRDSSIVAFVYGRQPLDREGLRIIGAHTDSPCLKVKTSPERKKHSYDQLGVEVYGGALLNPWFDRDLSIAGRVTVKNNDGSLSYHLLDLREPLAFIPSLAIHLDREANQKRSINPQEHLLPIIGQSSDAQDFRQYLLERLKAEHADIESVLDYDLSFYDCQPAAKLGQQQAFYVGARLDNLISCYLGLQAILALGREQSALLVCNDHEEVGSTSAIGARGPMLRNFFERLMPSGHDRQRMLHSSVMMSVDNAHGVHPNYASKHDANHTPILNQGPVLKFDANQNYATSDDTAGLMRLLAQESNIPLQSFVVRTDMRCGSTIGPLTAAEIGVSAVDIGVPTFGMHSIREMGGVADLQYLLSLLSAFVESPFTLP